MNLDKAFGIYQSFLDSITWNFDYSETIERTDNGNERALLAFSGGFNVELTNNQNVENSAALRCWWHVKESAVEIHSLEQLFHEFYRNN